MFLTNLQLRKERKKIITNELLGRKHKSKFIILPKTTEILRPSRQWFVTSTARKNNGRSRTMKMLESKTWKVKHVFANAFCKE